MGEPPNTPPKKDDTEKVPEIVRQGREFIAQVHRKMSKLVQEFADGEINRTQFQHLYARYQRQIMSVAQWITEEHTENWPEAIRGGEDTIHIRKRLTAKAVGMSVYDNKSGLPLETLGEFSIEPELIVPMLSSYRSAAAEIFRAGVRSTEMENGQWLCFVPGKYTTLIALFSLEPSDNQMETVRRMHKDFEDANRVALEAGNLDPAKLAYPFYAFVQRRVQSEHNGEADAQKPSPTGEA